MRCCVRSYVKKTGWQYRGYGLADFTPGQLNVRLRVLDDVQRQDSTVRTLAAFAVEAGRAEVLSG